MFKLTERHHRPFVRRGDLEEETAIVDVQLFKTAKSAKEYVEKKSRGKKLIGSFTKKDYYFMQYFTGYTWVNENTGETNNEYFSFNLSKLTAK
jgi:hypothetical protein